jgi:hypothetical protein
MAELAAASLETIWRRGALMASGRCTPAEYRRMVREKQDAARDSAWAALFPTGNPAAALLRPWLKRARSNARRLRRR